MTQNVGWRGERDLHAPCAEGRQEDNRASRQVELTLRQTGGWGGEAQNQGLETNLGQEPSTAGRQEQKSAESCCCESIQKLRS